MTEVVRPSDAVLSRLLSSHPGVRVVEGRSVEGRLDFGSRALVVGDAGCEVGGLVELMDNNPLVCASLASVPGPVATLGLVALGPLVEAGVLLESPVMQVAGSSDADDLEGFLVRTGWSGGVEVSYGDEDLGPVVAVNVMALVGVEGWAAVEELYRERYSRSLYVREHTIGDWDTSLVAGRPFALYSLSHTGESLLTVRVMADRDGKCGAAQVVHAFNVMCGYEESLGVGV